MRKSDQLTRILFDVSVNGERRAMQIRSISTYSFDVSANGDRRVIPSRRFPPKKRLLGNEWVSISSSFVICLLGWVNQERFFPLSKSCLNFFIVKKIESFAHLKMFSWIVAMCILTCVVGQDEEYSDGVGCIVHHPPHNDEFSCASLCDPTLIQAEIVKAVFLSGYYANFDCVKNKTSLKVCWNFFENMKKNYRQKFFEVIGKNDLSFHFPKNFGVKNEEVWVVFHIIQKTTYCDLVT